MKFSVKSVVIGTLLSLVLVFVFVPRLFARDGESGGTTTTTTAPPLDNSELPHTTTQEQPSTTNTNHETQSDGVKETAEMAPPSNKEDNPEGELRKDVTREKLDNQKKAVCESGQTAVNKAMSNVTERSTNQLERITAIYDMSVKFYADKGLTISNYTTLAANVLAAKTAAVTADQGLMTTPKLSCDSDGPKADIQAFRNKRLDKVHAFGAYRDAVKTFVKAVRVAVKATESTDTTPSTTSTDTKSTTTTGGTN